MSFSDRWRSLVTARKADPRAAVDATEPEWIAATTARGQRAVFADWVGVWTITNDGICYFAERVDLADQVEVQDARERNMARWQAAERYADLEHLRPVRRDGDYDCPGCGGTGQLALPPGTKGNIWCSCGGVGWLPQGYVDPHRDPAV